MTVVELISGDKIGRTGRKKGKSRVVKSGVGEEDERENGAKKNDIKKGRTVD